MIADGMTAAGERRWAARFSSVARHYQKRVDNVRKCGPKAHWAEVEVREREARDLACKVAYWRRAAARASDRARVLRERERERVENSSS